MDRVIVSCSLCIGNQKDNLSGVLFEQKPASSRVAKLVNIQRKSCPDRRKHVHISCNGSLSSVYEYQHIINEKLSSRKLH